MNNWLRWLTMFNFPNVKNMTSSSSRKMLSGDILEFEQKQRGPAGEQLQIPVGKYWKVKPADH